MAPKNLKNIIIIVKMIIFSAFLFISFSSAQSLGETLSTSYDPLRGNPVPISNNGRDPGSEINEIIELEYNQNKKTGDGMYSIADTLEVTQTKSCSYQSDIYYLYGENSYYDFLSRFLGFPANNEKPFGGSFSLSSDFERISKQTTQNYKVFVVSNAECVMYEVSLKKNAKIKFTANFKKEILKLIGKNPEEHEKLFFDFFDNFGICYNEKVVYGAQAIIESEYSRVKYDTLESQEFSFDAAAKASFLVFTGSNSLSSTEKSSAAKFDQSRDSKKQIFTGPALSSDGKWETWAKNVEKSPVPIKRKLGLIYDLIPYISEIDEISRENLIETLKIAILKYCFYKVGYRFYGPKPDLQYPKYIIAMKQSTSTYTVKCPSGYFLTSVMSRRLGNYDEIFYYNYYDDYTGQCNDFYGSECYIICASIPTKISPLNYTNSVSVTLWYSKNPSNIVKVDVQPYLTDRQVDCLPGYVVSGCYFQTNSTPINKDDGPPNLSIFPNTNASCRCVTDGQVGMSCGAICIKDTPSMDYEITTASGVGNIIAKCSKSYQIVLSCGFNYINKNILGFYAYPRTTECVCYSNSYATCYATCLNIYGINEKNCENCIPRYCTSAGCQKCEPEFYLEGGICVKKPCFEICPECTSLDKCKICESCTQNTNFMRKTCTHPSLFYQGCLPCPPRFYLTTDGYCTYCTNSTDPDKYRALSYDIGMCLSCSQLIENCDFCNDYSPFLRPPNCSKCKNDFYFDENGDCTKCEKVGFFKFGANDGSGKCYKKPCFDICPDCQTESQCEICSECSQCVDTNCTTCLNSSLVEFGCLPCKPEFYLNSFGNCERCSNEGEMTKFKKGSSDGKGICVECSKAFPHCSACDEEKCLKCEENFHLNETNQCTLCESPELFEINLDGVSRCIAKPCYTICPNCFEEDECKKCENCTQCNDAGCSTCSDPELISFGCLPCKKNNYLMAEGYCSLCDDPFSYRGGSSDGTGTCNKCNRTYSNCDICNNVSCLDCSHGYYLQDNMQCSPCNKDEYFKQESDDDNGLCLKKPCYSNCPTCISEEQCSICKSCTQCTGKDCSTCSDPQLISQGCQPCPKNYYINQDRYCTPCDQTTDPHSFIKGERNGTGSCVECSFYDKNCDICDGISCKRCKENYIFDTKKQCTLCIGEYMHSSIDGEKTCHKCSDFIENCVNCEDNICVECELGYFLNENNECIKCKDLGEYDPEIDKDYEKCSRCSQIMKGCFSCNKSICHQCLENNYHQSNTQCINVNQNPLLLDRKNLLNCSSQIENCVLCELFNTQLQCIKCDNGSYLTKEGLCTKCQSFLDFYIHDSRYCLEHSNPILFSSDSEFLQPNETKTINNREMWTFKEVCSESNSNTTFIEDKISVYWVAIPSSTTFSVNETFEFVKNNSISLNGLTNYDNFVLYGQEDQNQITINIPGNKYYKLFYYCDTKFDRLNTHKKGNFNIHKNTDNHSLTILMQFQIDDTNNSLDSNTSLVCSVEKLLKIENKHLLRTLHGIFF